MPYSVLLIFLPLGAVFCRPNWRWVMAGVLPVFVVLYTISVVYQIYYPIATVASVLLLILSGIGELSRALGPYAQPVRAALLLWVGLIAISALPEARRGVRDQFFAPTMLAQIDQWEANYQGDRALVLFRYSRQRPIDQEPVYNTTVAWPDDARIIRAQDLGEHNQKLFEYYAKIQPDRDVFRFDEGSRIYTRLGTVAELAK